MKKQVTLDHALDCQVMLGAIPLVMNDELQKMSKEQRGKEEAN